MFFTPNEAFHAKFTNKDGRLGATFIYCRFLIAKHKNAYISKTMQDRAILTKFLTHRITLMGISPNFQKNFVPPKMAVILNFRILRKTQKCITKAIQDRAISAKFLTHRLFVKTSLSKFEIIFHSPKWRPF